MLEGLSLPTIAVQSQLKNHFTTLPEYYTPLVLLLEEKRGKIKQIKYRICFILMGHLKVSNNIH